MGGGGGGLQPKKNEGYSKFHIWDWFFRVFFSDFKFCPILTGLTGSGLVVLVGYNSFYKTFARFSRH